MYDKLIHFSNVACNQFIPVLDTSRIKKLVVPWIKNELTNLIKKKKNLRYMNCACKMERFYSVQRVKTHLQII